ncbi:CLK4-associating serine/arginine rich protein isoform X1 [Drosophila navojoa]|uniref:CLK4-associating serine/arginine rich protein isoform X1 n=1 Tax=Drosophila navojoa TaxID=7232 RepID=UPI0011BDB92E|nr:CLK4-associating serine/arginine rich protein isoform X1 [Drosophila navojoa]
MWHEARKQERRIRGLIVDYRKRAERRQYFYDKIQADPTQFLQLHGRRCKIYLDPAVAAAGDGDAIIVPWQGHQDNLIDRFDVRAHLDYIAPVPKSSNEQGEDDSELTAEERQLNYERYRILAQNDFLNVSEDKFLHQLYLEEQYGANAQLEAERNLGKKKQKSTGGATIGYSYDDVGDLPSIAIGPQPFGSVQPASSSSSGAVVPSGEKAENSDESDSDIDMDVSIDIGKLDTAQAHELNACGRNYGMKSNDFFSHLTKDADEADALRIAREEEQEKMLLSGRKSRRERRAQKERRIANRPFSPPSYAAKEDQSKNKDKDEDSESRSPSPAEGGGEKITYITSFGGEDEMQPHSKITINLTKPGQTLGESCINASSGAASAATSVSYAQKVKDNLDKLKLMNESAKRSGRRRSHSTSRSPSRRRSRRRSYHRRSRTRSRRRRRYYSRSRSQSRTRSKSWERSRSPSYRRSRKRYSYSSGSSSASSYTKSRRRRSRSHSRASRLSRAHSCVKKAATPPATQKTQTICLSTTTTTTTASTILATAASVPLKQLLTKPAEQTVSAVPMISYPLSSRVLSMTTTAPAVIKATPVVPQVTEPPPPPLKRYYGRKRGNDTSSSSAESSDPSDAEEDESKQPGKSLRGRDRDDSDELDVDTASERSQPLMSSSSTGNQTGKYSSATETKGSGQASGSGRPNLRERLKRKMQNLLNRQYKADKRAEIEKTERERQLQQEREDEMRELALKLRRRRRELRHKYGTPSSGKLSDSDVDSVDSEAPARTTKASARRSRSRSGSHSRTKRHRSRSRSRRSTSRVQRKRRSRSPSRSRRQRSRSRSRRSNSRPIERKRRSHSRRRSGSRERRHSRSRRSQSQSRRRRQREHSLERARDRERYRQQHYERTHSAREEAQAHGSGSGSGSGNRGRVVISAPPKLKKLVDY